MEINAINPESLMQQIILKNRELLYIILAVKVP